MTFISAYSQLTDTNCLVNGEVILTRELNSEDSWFKQIYRHQNLAYPKFYKMDTLSQCGFILSELVKKARPDLSQNYADDGIGLVFANLYSSVDSDLKFRRSYEVLGAPSPALFVYTLPNIVLGEIAIANKWYGENMFAVLPKFTPDFFVNYVSILFATGSEAVMCGWLDVANEKVNAFVFLVEQEGSAEMRFGPEMLRALAGFD